MSSNRSAKVTISIIVSVVLLLAIVGTILLLIPKDNKPNGTLATMLDAPVNVSIDDNWKLTFDAVPNAVSYQIYVNGSPTKVVSGTTVDMSAYANVGKQGFAVQALHNLPSCNSTLSETVFKVKTLQLSIPQDLELTNSALFWGSVSGAKSYVLQIRYGNNEVQTSHSITSEFDFTTFLQQNSQITHFAVSVKATSVDVATNLRNEYILDSEFSEPKYYYKINSIDAPVISSTFTTPNQQGTDKIITWETDYFVQKYDVYLDNQLVKTIAYSEYENEDVYRLNLKELGVGDELGDHKVYIIATPKTNEGVETFTKKSNEIDYRVQYKLATPDSSTIRLVKEGTSLIIEWDEVVAPSGYTPTYNIKIGGKTNPDDVTSTYIDFKTVQNYKDNYYPFELSSLEATYKEFAVKIQACVDSSEYIINSDFSEYSAPAQAITKLNTPEGIVVGESAGIYTISWQAVNSSAVYGYFIEVYPAQEVAGQLELGERVLYVTVGADKQTRLTITDKLTEAGLQAGKYAFKITTLSNSRYYQNSDQSAAYQFVHKTRLATPVITTCQKQDENNNTSPITFKWTAVENAKSYIITVDSTTFTIDQPEGISAGQEITDTQKVSSVVSLYSEPKVFLITIQAIADSADDKHLNSIVSEVYSFRNTFKHQSVQNVQFSASGNNVNISWDAVSTVANLNSYYLVLINGKHSVRTASTNIEGISKYFDLGENSIEVYCDAAGMYSMSSATTANYTYSYDLTLDNAHSTATFAFDGTDKITITIPKFNALVTDYTLVFMPANKTIYGTTSANGDLVVQVGFEELPLYTQSTVSITAGKGEQGVQQYLTPITWTQNYTNNVLIDKPILSLDEDTYELTIAIETRALASTQMIELSISNDMGISYRQYITIDEGETTLNNSYIVNLLDVLTTDNVMPVGEYTIEATAYSVEAGVINTQTLTFIEQIILDTPTNFVESNTNSYLQWDKVSKAADYEVTVTFNGSPVVLTGAWNEYTITENSASKDVIRLATTTLFETNGIGEYVFNVVAKSSSVKIQDSVAGVYTWNLQNKLASPAVEVVILNEQPTAKIMYNALVSKYIISIDNSTTIETNSLSGTLDTYIYQPLNLNKAGRYEISVIATPINTSLYANSSATNVGYIYSMPFSAPTDFEVTQELSTNTITATWAQIVMSTAQGDTISPAKMAIMLSTIDALNATQWVEIDNTLSYEFDSAFKSFLATNGTGNYMVYLKATLDTNEIYSESEITPFRFAYREQTSTPVVTLNGTTYDTLNDLGTDDAVLTATSQDSRGNGQFDMQVTALNLDGSATTNVTVFKNLSWSASSQFEIISGTHVELGGLYEIKVRTSQNGKYAESAWSSALYLYYDTTLPNVTDVYLVKNGAQYEASFTPITETALTGQINYTATLSYTGLATPLNMTYANNMFTIAESAELNAAWAQANVTFVVSIVATGSAVSCTNVPLTSHNFTLSSTTNYETVVGTVNKPTDFILTTNQDNFTISWSGDKRYATADYTNEFIYVLSIQANDESPLYYNGSTWVANSVSNTLQILPQNYATTPSVTFALPDNKVYLITITITKVTATSTGGISASTDESTSAMFANTTQTADVENLSVDYNSNVYTVSWTHVSNNGSVFAGQTYTLLLGGVTVYTGTATSIAISADIINDLITFSRACEWSMTISDSVYVNDATIIGFLGKTQTGTGLLLPVVLSQTPNGLILNAQNVASWDNVQYATKYTISIENATSQVYTTTITSSDSTKTTIDLNSTISALPLGDYTLKVVVAEDLTNKVYVENTTPASTTFTIKSSMAEVEGLTFNTQPTTFGDFASTITWKYAEELETSQFKVSLTNKSTGEVAYITDTAGLDFVREYDNSVSRAVYTINLKGLNLNTNTVIGADPTRNLPAGEYLLGVQVLGDGAYKTDSAINYDATTYVNKFGVRAVTTQGSFAIAPECFFNESEVINNDIVITDSTRASYLSEYETKYGFNNKYLVITQAGFEATKATQFKILVNGKDAGVIDNTATTLDFNGIVSSNKLKLKDTDWQIGANTITLMPWGNENYFFYVDTTQSVPTPVTLSESVAKLQTEFDTNLYYRYNAPATPVTVDLTFSDKPVNHNITGVNIMFGQADASAKYAVTVHYLDHYDNNAQKVYGTFNGLNVDFDNNKSLGIAMYDLISTMGPHTIWFEVQRTAGGEANEQYYLDSFKANTQANKFVFTTVVQQFSSLEIAGQTTSIVQAINSTTEDTSICAQHSNGFLSWTLPTHPYSVQIKYSVSMLDKDRNFEKVYTDTLSLTINEDSDTIDYVWLENTGLFTIYNNLVYFDMREYFLDNTRVGASAGMYYLAGNYFFLISAQALDKVGTAVPTKIFSPNTFGANNNYMMFTYENIRYPFEPSNVVVDANGVLTWNYEGDTLYPTDPQRFKIIIETFKEDGTKYEEDIILDGDVTKQADISSYLVAGGKERNNVYVYRVAPNDTYRDSVSVKATFADDYPNTLSMPDFVVDWSDAREVYLRLPSGIPAKTYREVTDNGKTINFNLSIMRITSGKDLVQPTDTFDSILANTNGITFVTQNLGSIEYDTSTEYKMNIYDRLQNLDATNWLDGEALIAGLFILKVELSTDHIYYTSNIKNIQRGVKDIWKVYDTPTLTGEYLTLKNKNQEAQPVNSNDRNWANAAQKDAILTFVVGTIADDNGTLYLPENVTVTMKLYNGIDYDLDRIYSITYALPTLNDLGTNAEAVLGDVTISRYFDNGAERHEYKYVTINLHKFFDLTSSEVYAGPYAGVYHMTWKVDGDSIGDSSVTQTFEKEICHYTVIPTPILDYRLGYTSTGSLYTYVLNWGFIPNQYTYMINDSADYNLNIFAFEKRANGTYACDEEYNSLTDEQKIFFLQDRTNLSFEIEKNLLDFATIYTIDGRRCYVNYATNSGLELIPNKEYKFFMYLSKKSSSTDPNAIYYLDSETSKGQEYLYKQVSTNHINSIAGESASGIVPVESETNYNDGMYYTFSSKQDSNNYNNAFELFVYDTQDPRAGTDNTWMIDQEINGTYLAHYIISTKDNANANSKTQDLFIVEGYQDRVIGSGTYGKKVGILSGSQITLDLFTLQDLLADKTLKPITYYCKIKTWIDNNLVNANAPLDDNGDLEDAVIYGEKWIKQNITTDPQLVQNYVDTLASKVISVPFLDLNSYNPSTYFSFQHKIKFATPNISKIEIVNETGYDDVSGVCEVTYSNSSTGVTTGFITAEADGHYVYKIYLDGVYNPDEIITQDKYIRLDVSSLTYSEATGETDFNGTAQTLGSATLKVHYDGTTAYVVLARNSTEGGAQDLFWAIDERLPNKLSISATAVMGGEQNNTGEDNTENAFINEVDGKVKIARIFVDSSVSLTRQITIKKQYTAPMLTMMYDSMGTELVDKMATNPSESGADETNVLSSGEYIGMALTPYVYINGANYPSLGAQSTEYAKLSFNDDTLYKFIFTYKGNSVEIERNTKDINATLSAFKQAVLANSTRYDYSSYSDVYPYELASVYQIIYDLIRDTDYGASANNGDYQGGTISVGVQTIAPTNEETAGYWVSSDVRQEFTMDFYTRLETVQTSFNPSLATFEDLGVYANFYKTAGYYYNYQSVIPFDYTPISKDTTYKVYLTRPYAEGSGELEYSYDTFDARNKNLCVWTPNSTSQQTENLSNILAYDLYDPATGDLNYNQWRLSSGSADVWTINVLAVPTNSMNFTTRGFDSFAHTYEPKLKLVQDINSLSINMTFDRTTGVVYEFTQDNITYSSLSTFGHNKAVYTIEIEYTNESTGTIKSKSISINQGSDLRYYRMFIDFINSCYVNDSSVIGGEYKFRYYFTSTNEDVEDSEWSVENTFEYYKQINFNDISVNVTQANVADQYLTFTASVPAILTVTGMNVTLEQTLLTGGTNSSLKTTTRSGTDEYVFSTTWAFNSSYADCFSESTFSSADITLLTTQGYVSSVNKGYLQGGINKFNFCPTQDPAQAKYNLLPQGYKIPAQANFIVPESLCPTVTLSNTSSSEGGATEETSRPYSYSCTKCRGSGEITVEIQCDRCGGDGTNWDTCGTCDGEGEVPIRCTKCGGSGETVSYGSHDLTWDLRCKYCGGLFANGLIGNTTCTSNKSYNHCTSCDGQGDLGTKTCSTCKGSGVKLCSKCGGDPYDYVTEDCGTCGGDGTISGTDYGTKYYAYYKYVSKLTATYTNNGGCSYSGNWSYGWKSSHSSCTRTTFSKSGSGSTKSSVSSVSLAGEKANYVTYNVTVRVKSGFENVFKRTSQTKTLKADYSSAHYETYTDW